MSSTNKTTHYELPQFVENDIFNPLVDDNDAYEKIDTALYNIADAEADDAAEIVATKGRLDTVEGKVDALETQNGTNVLTTVAQTLSGAVNELKSGEDSLDGRLDAVEDDVNNATTGLKVKVSALETQNGSEVLSTTAQTLSGAVNEIVNDMENVKIYFPANVIEDSEYRQDSTMMLVSNKKGILIDCGYPSNETPIVSYYTSLVTAGVLENVDKIIITHYHQDHIGNLGALLAALPHGDCTVYLPLNPNGYYTGSELTDIMTARASVIQTCNNAGVPYVEVDAVTTFNRGNDLTVKLMNSTIASYTHYSQIADVNYNNYSMIVEIKYGDTYMYFLGDIQGDAELYCANNYDIHKADFCVLNHHGMQWDSNVAFMNKIAPNVAIYQTDKAHANTDNLGDIVNYNCGSLYTTAYGKIEVALGKAGGVIDGIEVARKNTTTNYIGCFVDNSYTGESDGTADKPFKNIYEALNFAPKELRSLEYKISVKKTDTPYDTLILNSLINNIFITKWGDDAPIINGFSIYNCAYVGLASLVFAGISESHSSSMTSVGEIIKSYVILNRCEVKSADTTQVDGIKISNGSDVKIRNCTFDTLLNAYIGYDESVIECMTNTFKNTTYCHYPSRCKLTIYGIDTMDANCTVYIRGSMTTYTTPFDVSLSNNDDFNSFKALCAKNGGAVISNYFKHGDSKLSIVGQEVFTSQPLPVGVNVTDCDLAISTGFYVAGGSASNKPTAVSSACTIFVIKIDASNCTQLCIPINSTTIYIRQRVNGTFGSWQSITPV